jgi:hypothetical protein
MSINAFSNSRYFKRESDGLAALVNTVSTSITDSRPEEAKPASRTNLWNLKRSRVEASACPPKVQYSCSR